MEITNEDKKLLLEKLGYSVEGNFFTKKNTQIGFVSSFNPLDISILSKLMDVVEKIYHTFIEYVPNDKVYTVQIDDEKDFYIYKSGSTREEAILKAVLQYFKDQKK